MSERRLNWTPAGLIVGGVVLIIVALLLVFRGGGEVAPAPVASVSPPPVGTTPAPPPTPPPSVVVEAAVPPLDADLTADDLAALSMPAPSVVDVDAKNPEIKPELPQTPDWKMGKTQQILAVVGRRAERVKKDIEDLEKAGKSDEAAEKKVLLKRLEHRMEAMRKEIADLKTEILADGGVVPDGGFAPDGAPIW